MAPGVDKDLVAEIKKYYDAQESYMHLLHQAVQQELEEEHDGKPKHRYADSQRAPLEQKTKPVSDHSWETDINPKEIMKTFHDLSVKASGEGSKGTKKGSKA